MKNGKKSRAKGSAASAEDALLSRITIDPEICHGKPAIRHLRYPVESMLEYLAAGDSFEDLLEEFPDLERDDSHGGLFQRSLDTGQLAKIAQ